jgi:succinate dehydrogenase / fumarate reductase flavoprotein subunit
VGGGGFSNTPDLVEALVRDAPLVVQWLESLGCMFEKEADGTMRTVHGGGSSRKRMHYARDQIGREIMITLRDEVRNRQIPVLEFSPAVELITDEKGQVAGGVLQNLETDELIVVVAKTTVLATGGAGRLHFQGFPTTNHYGASADGLALAYRVGANLTFIDAIQYHPTVAVYPEQIVGLLVAEKACYLGAQVVNVEGEQFVHTPEMPDVMAAAIIRECLGRNKGLITPTGQPAVWLDFPLIDAIHGKGTIASQFPTLLRRFKRFDFDITGMPILVYPALHYQNGGVKILHDGQTDVPNLYAAGEVAGGVHGRSRLVGNSLADAVVFGRRAGSHAGQRAKEVNLGRLTLQHVREYRDQLETAGGVVDLISPLLLPDYAGPTNSKRDS